MMYPDRNPDKRQAILDASLMLFCDFGFHGTTMPAIARKAKVGAGTIYRYFESKEQLVNVLFRHWKETYGAALLQDFPFDASPRDQLRAYWRAMVDFARDNPRAYAFLELHHHARYLDPESLILENRLLDLGMDVIKGWQAMGHVKEGPVELIFAVLYGAFSGVFKAVQLRALTLNDDVMDQAERCVWEAIRR